MTVVQVLPALESGGVERSTLEIADALVQAGHRAIVVSGGGRLVPALQASGAEHVTLDLGRKSLLTLRHVGALRRLLIGEQPNIVHARSRLPAWLAWYALRRITPAQQRSISKPHFVTTVHGLNSPSRYSAVMTRGERVICVSDSVRDHLLRHYPRIDRARLRVIPRGIDPDAFTRAPGPDRAARARIAAMHPALAGMGPLLLMPGRGTRLKGHADALALLAQLRGDGLDARLWMPGTCEAGREAYVAELERAVHACGLADAVAMTAPTAAIAEAYTACDLVLQLSRRPEAFGRTVLEALSVGRPVLGWAHGGVGELLAQYQPRGAVVPFDPQALALAAHDLLAHPPAPPITMSAHTLRAMQQATLAVYAELVDPERSDD